MNWALRFATIGFLCVISISCSQSKPTSYVVSIPKAVNGPQHLLLGQTININTATAADLEALPGIGTTLAGRIISDRDKHGPFLTVADLERVPGIGKSKLSQITTFISTAPKY
ncbi:MAG: hypothetical protein COV45_05730 [Deltaproteobacteria bacterium CG11_big_fil_rev_8_21_14_0_20_47_16]|nr:MAG: hypothetical protein COV45_05730 [Deltaproteobacteria bacterium CG11_big_fil_rev_8_21_14_0_20_47_16]